MALSTDQLRQAWGPPCSGTKVTVTLNGGGVVHVRAAIVDAVKALNAVLVQYGYRTRRADTGAYVCRMIAGTNRYSLHAYGTALDISWQLNPQRKPLTTNMPRAMVAEIEAIRTNSGAQVWRWGGHFSTPDAMHYEICCSPRDIASGIRGQRPAPAPPPKPQPEPEPQLEVEEEPMFYGRHPISKGVYAISGNTIRALPGGGWELAQNLARLTGTTPRLIEPTDMAEWAIWTANLMDTRTGRAFDHRWRP